jgi:hypothetical protein
MDQQTISQGILMDNGDYENWIGKISVASTLL